MATAGIPILEGPISTGSLTINGTGADDNFSISLVGGDPIPPLGIAVNGLGQTTGDKVTIFGGAAQATVTHNFTNLNDGSIMVLQGTVSYVPDSYRT